MFETIQIARGHLLRLENAEVAAMMDDATSPVAMGGVLALIGAWADSVSATGGPDEDPQDDPDADEDTDQVGTTVMTWPLYPFY